MGSRFPSLEPNNSSIQFARLFVCCIRLIPIESIHIATEFIWLGTKWSQAKIKLPQTQVSKPMIPSGVYSDREWARARSLVKRVSYWFLHKFDHITLQQFSMCARHIGAKSITTKLEMLDKNNAEQIEPKANRGRKCKFVWSREN